ncbi:TPA: patatin-like phospholipase family protein [bacterium]|nr:patatin-like phospholipase family protein [bacterium]
MSKLALVLSGGGSKGSYQVGAYEALKELGFTFDIITNTSVGALNGAIFVQGEEAKAYHLWENIDYDKIVKLDIDKTNIFKIVKEVALNKGLDTSPLENLLHTYIDESKIRASQTKFGLVVVKYPSLKSKELTLDEINEGQLVDYLLASSSCFPAFKVKTIDGQKYIDGGYFDNLPINLAVKLGASEVIAIDIGSGLINKKKKFEGVGVTYIRPRKKLGMFLAFDANVARRNFKYGYNDVLKTFKVAVGLHFTFIDEICYQEIKSLFISHADLVLLTQDSNVLNKVNKIELIKKIYQSDKERVFIKSIETIAKIFNMDDGNTYHLDDFNTALIDKIKLSLKDLDLNKPLNKLNDKEKTIKFTNKIKETIKNERTFVLSPLITLYEEPFLAALYLSLIVS